MGGVFCKKWTFPQRRVHYVQYQYFLFYILLIWGCIRTERTPPTYGPRPPASRVAMPPLRERSVAIRYAILTCAQKLSDSQHNLAREAGKQKSDEKDLDQNTDVLRRTGASERFVTSVDEE